jgi:A/G-specific adenine glycosylase
MNSLPLQKWFINHQRDLPFRHTTNPYLIWVSEVMLQQTQMDTMLPYYERFMNQFPTVYVLAQASLEHVLTLVQGIGYYRRFKLLHQGAKYIVEMYQGTIPNQYDLVRSIPGVGDYTAGAIMSIAFHAPYAATDGNVIRVLSRYYGISTNLTLQKERKRLHAIHQHNIENAQPYTYTQAVMELGALVCKPVQPACSQCPIQKTCYAFQHNMVQKLPILEKKVKHTQILFHTCMWIKNNRLALVKNNRSLLEGMYLLPQIEVDASQIPSSSNMIFTAISG